MTTLILTILAVLLRILSNPLGNVFQKQLTSKANHPLVVNFLTYFILSILCVSIAVSVQWDKLSYQFWFYSILGGIAGSIGNGFLVKAMENGDLSVLGPINSYKSVVAIIIGIFMLGGVPNVWGLLGIALIIWGSYFVLNTTEEKFSFALFKRQEIQYRVWALILTAIEAVFVKKVIILSSPTIAFISWCWFGAAFSFILLFLSKINLEKVFVNLSNKKVLVKYCYLVACIGIMQFTTNYTFAHMPVGYALSLFQLSIIVSVLLGYKIFKEGDITKKLVGSVIMIIGSIVIILLKK